MTKIQTLKDLISNILKKMFFLNEETAPDKFMETFFYSTEITDNNFHILLLFSDKLACEITENFLGFEDYDQEDVLDCLQEVVNMITGNFIGICFPEHDKLLPFPTSSICDTSTLSVEEYESDYLFYHLQPLKILYKEIK